MCQYRYYYYAGCRHQRTVLVTYCANATPAATARHHEQPQHPPRPPSTAGNSDPFDDDDDNEGSAGSIPDLTSNSTVPSSSPTTTTTSDSHTSRRQYLLTSIFQPTPAVASLHLHRLARRHSHPVIVGMATLPTFARSNWREPFQLIVGAATNNSIADVGRAGKHNQDNLASDTNARARTGLVLEQPGQVHQSIDGHSSAKVPPLTMQSSQHPEQKIQRHSVASRTECEYAEMYKELAEARQEVKRLQREASAAETRACSNHPSSLPCQEDHDSSTSVRSPQHSPAALLQREHEKMQLQQAGIPDVAMHDTPTILPSSLDFPGLQMTEHALQRSWPKSNAVRKPSYASMVTHAGVQTGEKDCIPSEQGDEDKMSSSATQVPATIFESSELAIVSRGSAHDGRRDQDALSSLKSSTPAKVSPRFAQPTKAFSRRADETIRKTNNSNANGTATETKSPSLCSAAQKQQKRKSLPGDWLSGSPSQTGKNSQSAAKFIAGSPLSSEQVVAIQTNQESNIRKKASTYRSPTKAATQRTIATIGQEATSPASPRLQRNLDKMDVSPKLVKSTVSTTSGEYSPTSTETNIQVEVGDRRMSEVQPRTQGSVNVTAPRRSTIGAALPHSRPLPANTSIAEVLSQQARAAGLPMVANTTTQRRGSHGHLLIPIKAKLDRIGILREGPHAANVRGNSDPFSPGSRSNHSDPFSPPPSRPMYDIQEVSSDTSHNPIEERHSSDTLLQNKKVVVPPHVRAALRNAAAHPLTTPSIANGQAAQILPSLRATAQEFRPMVQQIQQPLPQQAIPQYQNAPLISAPFPSNAAPSHVLAAGAEPQPKSMAPYGNATPTPDNGFPTIEQATRFYDDDEWSNMTPGMRHAILDRRADIRGVYTPFHQSRPQSTASIHGQYAGMQPLSTACPDVFGTSPANSHIGQVLLPRMNAVSQALQWTAKPGLNAETPVLHGGAAMPMLPSPPMAPRAGPTSFITSEFAPPRTPGQQPRSWTIGSDQLRRVYGWKGGDGREIKFIGHGPDAERDPNSGVRFHYQRRVTSTGRGPRLVGGNDESGSPEIPLAPRSRHHWAQLAGNMRQPCDKMEIVDAVEQVPLPGGQALYGYCGNCSISTH
ncbi:hypothetical protein CERZMDRAFT_102520 [Cercospora zeae-maydis SCOH1-5]|uniref:Uncharacterized protein n=1 Tax=Cercospora zeae-maydis SCOH1-5 TaxID=717836 RepID=A0A6A6EZV9_9PEZI|nr:hypothetical protein CERZMDRAFT_102520 [Cercospora zeae-maydis SCOH1-5]